MIKFVLPTTVYLGRIQLLLFIISLVKKGSLLHLAKDSFFIN